MYVTLGRVCISPPSVHRNQNRTFRPHLLGFKLPTIWLTWRLQVYVTAVNLAVLIPHWAVAGLITNWSLQHFLVMPLLTGARSPAASRANTTQSVDLITVFKVGHSAIGGQMHSIGSAKLAHVNRRVRAELVTPLNPLHGDRAFWFFKEKKHLFIYFYPQRKLMVRVFWYRIGN